MLLFVQCISRLIFFKRRREANDDGASPEEHSAFSVLALPLQIPAKPGFGELVGGSEVLFSSCKFTDNAVLNFIVV